MRAKLDAETLARAKEKATKQSIQNYLPGGRAKDRCPCVKCWPQAFRQTKPTIRNHVKDVGAHPDSHLGRAQALSAGTSSRPPMPAIDSRIPERDDISMRSYHFEPQNVSVQRPDLPPFTQSPLLPPVSSPIGSERMSTALDNGFPSSFGTSSGSRSHSPLLSHSGLLQGVCSESPRAGIPPSASPISSRIATESDSNEEEPYLRAIDPVSDMDFFGWNLTDLSISRAGQLSYPPLSGDPSPLDDEEENGNNTSDEDSDSGNNNDHGGDGGRPDDPDDPDGVRLDGPRIQVPPDDAGGVPGDPGGDDARWDIPAMEEDPTLRNIYLRTWVQYAFYGVTQEVVQRILESHKYALLAGAHLYTAEFIDEVNKMPTTLRSLERRLGMDFSELLVVYAFCPECGKRYTLEELNALRTPQCLRHVGDRCTGILYEVKTLADGTQKRTPTQSLAYNPLPNALGRALSRVGIINYIQNAPLENPPGPRDPQEWFEQMGENTRFGDIRRAYDWHAQATGLRRFFNGEEYVDEPTGDAVLSLAHLPIGLNLTVGADGYQAFKGNFVASGSYSAYGVYVVINNLPFYLRNLIENMILVMVLPGPHEPKGYAFDQMMEPLVNDLIELAAGVELPVYNPETRQIQPRQVYANLSLLTVDWISRIKCTGHAGVASEHNHCPYCKIRQCLLAIPQGYQPDGYELREPYEHLQLKHRWLRAPEHEREAIREETGTIFTELDRVPGFFAFNNAPIDAMHLLDLGTTRYIARNIVYKSGMLRKRFHGQDYEDSPEGRFNAFLARTIYPHHCSRIPTKAAKMGGGTKAEQWRLLCLVMPVAYFEAWRVGDAIPDGNIPRGGRSTRHFKYQEKNARKLLRRRRNVHHMFDGDPDELPQLADCTSSRNPRDYYGNILRYCLAYTLLTRHQVTLLEIGQAETLLEQVGTVFTEMNIHLTPSFHAATHLPDHIRKYGSVYNTSTARFERANRLLANVNTNGRGHGTLETTMAKGFLRRTEGHRYVTTLQAIQEPSEDDTRTIEVLLRAMRHGPEHEVQHGRLDDVLAGEVPMHGQEEIQLATRPAKVNFRDPKHRDFYGLMIQFCNQHRPPPLHNVVFYGFGRVPDEGAIQAHISSADSTVCYPYFRRYGVRYGSANHNWGLNSRYGYINNRVPVIIHGIYETTVEVRGQEHKFLGVMIQRFVAPDEEPAFPWNHWNDVFGIDAWMYNQFTPLEAVPPTVFTGVFALSDLTMRDQHFWITIAMLNTRPEDRVAEEEVEDDDD